MPRPALLLSTEAAEAILAGALAATRAGSLGEYLRQRRQATRWFVRRHLQPVLGTAGDALLADTTHERATLLLLRWGMSRLRPDQAALDAPIDDAAWLERTSWRPFLALACHFGLVPVPRFDARYRRSAEESPAENLCGLWNVGPSTFYRYLDKARRMMVEALQAPAVRGEDRVALRDGVHAELARHDWAGEPADVRRAWHLAQSASTAAARDASSALWHALQAGDAGLFVRTLRRFRIELADKPETDVLLDRMARRPVTPRDRVELRLSEAMLWRTRDNAEREYRACEQALRLATEQGDRLLLGLVYGTTAWFHESRDVDRALACAEDSAEFLRQAELEAAPGSAEAGEVSVEYVAALVRLAWLLVLRNSPRSRTVLDLAEARRTTPGLSHEPLAMLEQTWGEYWRRAGDLRLAIAFKHKALNISERVGDTRQTLSTYNNLSVLYLEAREYQRAIEHASRVVTHSETSAVDPYLLTSALGNIGIGLFWQQRYDEAIEMYRRGLVRAEAADLRVIAHRAHFNLAEAYFKRFQLRGDPADEAEGDRHLAIVQAAPPNERDAWFQEAAPTLKADALGLAGGFKHERFWGEESTEHFEEMREVQRQRAVLAVPAPAAAHVAARLAIANAYAAISTKERETAIAMIERHALGSAFEAEINRLGVTFSRGLTREKALMAQWKQKCYGVLTEERIGPVLHQVIATGSINKSGYAQLCQVGLATASKHLGTLTERGLLVQTGKGPSTRYMLP